MRLHAGLGAIALFVSTACATTEEREFRARLAQGCESQKECAELQREAAARNEECQAFNERHPAPMDARDCTAIEEDAEKANGMFAEMARYWPDPQTERDAEEKARAQRAAAAEDARVSALGDSCEALAAIEDAAAHAQPPRDAQYRELARTRRASKVAAFSAQIDQVLQSKPDLSDLAAARAWVPRTASTARTAIGQLRCYDADAAASRTPRVDAWMSSTTDAIDKEEACRASPRCLADRNPTRQSH